jgi:TPR repeat protein
MLHGRPDPADQPAGQNRREAIEWLCKAALQGLPRAQAKLAEIYASPPLDRGDEVRACTWFLVATSSVSGIHLHRAKTEFERLAAGLRPGQLREAKRGARAILAHLRGRASASA